MAVATFQADLDSYMQALYLPNGNHGSETGVFLDAVYGGGAKTWYRRAIGNFDVSSLSGAAINSAKLVRTIGSVTAGGFAAKLSRCTRPATVTESGVSWNNYDTAVNPWTAAGGDLDDVTPGVIDYTEASATGSHEITGLAGYVTDALDNRDGIVSIIMRMTNEAPGSTVQVGWWSKEYGTPASRWYLEVDYTPPTENRRRVFAQVV